VTIDQDQADLLDELARDVRVMAARLDGMEQGALDAQLGLGTPGRIGSYDLGPLALAAGGGGPIMPASVIQPGAVEAESFSATAFIRLVTNAGATVVIDASGLTVTGGAITVRNPTGVVIIDGTSNMFKIAATGTQSKTITSETDWQSATTTLSGLGALPTTPAHLCYVSDTNTTTGFRYLTFMALTPDRDEWASDTNGGVTNVDFTAIRGGMAQAYVFLNGSSQAVVGLACINGTSPLSHTYYETYYVMKEAAL
jgi:hypothetical protein